jgi:hypothetical protein
MKTYSSLKKIKQGKYVYIYLYFNKLDHIIRINTKNEFIPKCMNRDLTYNSKMGNKPFNYPINGAWKTHKPNMDIDLANGGGNTKMF